jgi:hypothetical protein
MCASWSCLQVQGFEWAGAETRHPALYAVQLLEVLNAIRMRWKQPRAPSAAASQVHWRRPSRSAVSPLATTLNSKPVSDATLLLAHQFECFLRVLTTNQGQAILAQDHSAPSSHTVTLETGSHAPKVNQFGSEIRQEDELKLSKWPWSILGKEVRVHVHASRPREACLSVVIANVLTD